jgi:hypothetical protein
MDSILKNATPTNAMSTNGAGARARYLVQSPLPGAVARFLEAVAGDPEMEIVDRIGPPGEPHTAVLVMAAPKADALKQQFRISGQGLTIEPDRPLSLY